MMMNKIPRDLKQLNRDQIFNASLQEVNARLISVDIFAHKGTRGHAAIVAGSIGMMGAALLCTRANIRSGCGKTTAFVSLNHFDLVHAQAPEALLVDINHPGIEFSSFNAIGIGPGLGNNQQTTEILENSFTTCKPMVIDADALNCISTHKTLLEKIPKDSILTPHLREWERLFGKAEDDFDRINRSIDICKIYNINILIKGYYSVLTTHSGAFFINGTGNAGMAKAGSGDVLTGLLTGLLAMGYPSDSAGIIGMFVHGLAGDIAKEKLGEASMCASDLVYFFPHAFQRLKGST